MHAQKHHIMKHHTCMTMRHTSVHRTCKHTFSSMHAQAHRKSTLGTQNMQTHILKYACTSTHKRHINLASLRVHTPNADMSKFNVIPNRNTSSNSHYVKMFIEKEQFFIEKQEKKTQKIKQKYEVLSSRKDQWLTLSDLTRILTA